MTPGMKLPPGATLEGAPQNIALPPGATLETPPTITTPQGELAPYRYIEGMPVYRTTVAVPAEEYLPYGSEEGLKFAPLPGPATPPMAPELQRKGYVAPTLQNIDPRTGEFIGTPGMGTLPFPLSILDTPVTGGLRAGEGIRRTAGLQYIDPDTGRLIQSQGTDRDILGGLSETGRGTMEALTPLMVGEGIVNPYTTAAILGTGTALGATTEATLNWMGAPKEYSAFFGDLAGIMGAGWTYRKMGSLAKAGYIREGNSINQRIASLIEAWKDPNLTEMDRNAIRVQINSLTQALEENEREGPPSGLFLPQLSARETLRGMVPNVPRFLGATNRLNPVEQASQDFFTKDLNIPTSLSMQTGSPVAAGFEGAVRNAIGGSYAVKQRDLTRDLAIQRGREMLGKLGPEATPEQAGAAVRGALTGGLEKQYQNLASEVSLNPATPESAGTKVLETGKAVIRNFDRQADTAYKAAWQAERDPRNIENVPVSDEQGHPVFDQDGNRVTEKMPLPIDMRDLKYALAPVADRYEYTLRETDARASLGLKAMRNIINGPDYKPASAAELDLGMLKDASRNENIPELRDTSQGLAAMTVKQLQEAIDGKMANAAYPGWDPSSGTPSPAVMNLRAGRKATAQKYDVADVYRKFGPNLEKVEPVGAYQRLIWAGDAGIQHLRDVAAIAPDAMPDVGRAFIDSGGNWDKLGPETKKILFRDPNVIAGLDDYYARQDRFGKLAGMEPVGLFEHLTQPEGRVNELLADVQKNAPEQMPGLGRAFVQGLLDKITREGDINKVDTYLSKYLNMDGKAKSMLLGDPKLVSDWQNFFFGLKRLNKEVNTSGTGYINALNKFKGDILRGMGMMGGAVVGGTHGGAEGTGFGVGAGLAAGTAAEWALNKVLARALYDPRFTRLLNRGMREELNGNEAGVRLTSRDLMQKLRDAGLLDEEPPEGPPTGGGGTPPPNPPPAPASEGPAVGGGPPSAEITAPAGQGSLQERLQTIGDEAFDRVRKSGTFQGRTLPSMFPAEVTKDMATWGAARIANGAIDFAKWSKAMLADAADISPEAAAKVKSMLPGLYAQAQKEYEHHVQTLGAGNIADLPTIMKYYQAGKEGKNWYNFVRPALQPLFGENTDLFLKMFAATSPNTKVTQNVLNAVKAYRQFLLGEPFTGMPAHVDNLNRAVADVKMSGPKVGAFAPNLLGDLNPVTVDLWMARAILGRDTVTPLQSKLVDYMTSQAAKKAGLQPAEMQAAIWTGIKKLQGSRDTSAPPEVVINQYLDKNPDVRKLFEESMQMSKEHFAGLQSKQAPAKPPRN